MLLLLLAAVDDLSAQDNKLWHGIERSIHYKPDGDDFVLVNGKRRFNRALYGGNSGFRAEAGDLPEFALYLPGMGGNLKFGFAAGDSSKWMIDAKKIETRYRPGSMIYKIQDPLLGNGSLTVTALAPFDAEALLIKVESIGIPSGVQMFAVYGGATGTRFSREGDIGADPESSFYLKPEYCKGNIYKVDKNSFTLYFGSKSLTEAERYEIQYRSRNDTSALPVVMKQVSGIFPTNSQLKIADANRQVSPVQLISSTDSLTPVISAQIDLTAAPLYFFIANGVSGNNISYDDLQPLFDKTEAARKVLAGRIKINTPDAWINTLGGALAVASDAVWEEPSFMHGAVAWRMRLNGWRGAYLADALGWHDRARMHFSSYALSQFTSPASGPVEMDTALHLARHAEKMGTSVFSSGYISRNPGGDKRPHHYDMNLGFIDQLLNHFLWTGDTAYVKSIWPLLKRHLDWENRNFDVDGDHLYDAYAVIWASDALQYSGGGVTHSSAYNYKGFKMAAMLAPLVGKDPGPYRKKAAAILNAINTKLWMPAKGVYAEYKDVLGKQLLHPSPAVWTIYHAIDSEVPDNFRAYQSLRYIDNHIPRIPIRAKGFDDTSLYTISTTNWQPYTWSLNNVVLAEVMHTALAYWQGGRSEEAYALWKGSLVESMYLGASPGNFHQLSFYDAIRGELYRDFTDDIGMVARSLVEGLFGVFFDALHDTLYIKTGFPAAWDHASISTPDIDLSFKRESGIDTYKLTSRMPVQNVLLKINAQRDGIASITANGRPVKWKMDDTAIGMPKLVLALRETGDLIIEIKWKGNPFSNFAVKEKYAQGQQLRLSAANTKIVALHDPQRALTHKKQMQNEITALVADDHGHKTFFVKLKQGIFTYWQPVNFKVVNPIEIMSGQDSSLKNIAVNNNTASAIAGKLFVNNSLIGQLSISANSSLQVQVPPAKLVAGTNAFKYEWKGGSATGNYLNWDINNSPSVRYEKIDLSSYFNDEVNQIFKNKYLSPRPAGPTMQLPIQGIGNWAYPLVMPVINDSGLRVKAGINNELIIAQGVPFSTPSAPGAKNIIFTSQWDNYPDSAIIPLSGKAAHAYLLMAGSTNPMQTRMTNGEVVIQYKDGSLEKLELINPQNWWPIEQDYYEDGFAFTTGAPKPVRVYFKTGEDTRAFRNFTSLRGFSNRAIEGGAATVLDLPLDAAKKLKQIIVKAIANDVVIGLMSVTLVR
ncbi:MAG: DUF4450 domain-containing protein [Chitinophagaceae bacterium]